MHIMKTLKNYLISLSFLLLSSPAWSQWNNVKDFPLSTDGSFTFVIGDVAYVNGGLASNDFYSFNETDNQWTKLADVPSSGDLRAWAFAFAINGKGYIAGGSYKTAGDLEKTLWEYDPVENKWTQKADFPGGARDGGYAFAIGNKGYIGGGFDGQYLHNDLYEYDPVQNKWTAKTNYPGGPVIFPASFVINGKAYVGTGDQGGIEIQQFWEYNPDNDKWTQKADFAGEKRQTAIGYALGNRGYIGGGMFEYNTNRKDFWEYNPWTNSWSKVADADLTTNHTAWSSGFVIGNNLYYGLGVDFPAFTFSNKFFKRTFPSTTGLNKTEKLSKIKIFPNPVQDYITIESEIEEIEEILLYDIKGTEILRINGNENPLDISTFENGVYVLQINTSGEVFREKIIIQAE
jgi:N-acetylneuraminic acid mutarotase